MRNNKIGPAESSSAFTLFSFIIFKISSCIFHDIIPTGSILPLACRPSFTKAQEMCFCCPCQPSYISFKTSSLQAANRCHSKLFNREKGREKACLLLFSICFMVSSLCALRKEYMKPKAINHMTRTSTRVTSVSIRSTPKHNIFLDTSTKRCCAEWHILFCLFPLAQQCYRRWCFLQCQCNANHHPTEFQLVFNGESCGLSVTGTVGTSSQQVIESQGENSNVTKIMF